MSPRILDLSMLPWQFGRVERQPFGAQPIDDRASVTEWLPARVPGDVRADLIAAGRVPPIETPEGIAAGAWVDDYDWWYRAELPGDLTPDEVAILEADGIDYYSASRAQGADRKAAPLRGSGCRPFDGLRTRPCRGHRGHAAHPGDGAAGRDRSVPAATGNRSI